VALVTVGADWEQEHERFPTAKEVNARSRGVTPIGTDPASAFRTGAGALSGIRFSGAQPSPAQALQGAVGRVASGDRQLVRHDCRVRMSCRVRRLSPSRTAFARFRFPAEVITVAVRW